MLGALLVMALATGGTTVTGSGSTITGSGSTAATQPHGIPAGYQTVQIPATVGAGTYCLHTVVVPFGTHFPPYNGVSTQTEVACPGAAPTPAQLAHSWAQSAQLPRPTLTVQPGYAVTGLTAYLEIGTPPAWSTTFANVISVSCHHTGFDVDWGDGTPRLTTPSTGGPYPRGDVTHAYQEATPGLAVQVVEHWVCAWSDGAGAAGTLTGLTSTATRDLEVREIQAHE